MEDEYVISETDSYYSDALLLAQDRHEAQEESQHQPPPTCRIGHHFTTKHGEASLSSASQVLAYKLTTQLLGSP